MVCIPCIVIPALLFIWHKWLQPIVLKFWNPFGIEAPKEDTWYEARQAKLNQGLINDATDSFFKCPMKPGASKVEEAECEKKAEEIYSKVDWYSIKLQTQLMQL